MSLDKLNNNATTLAKLAFTVGILLIMLSKFTTVSGSTAASNTAINAFITGIGEYADWVGIVVLIGVGGYFLSTNVFGSKKE